MKESFRIPHRKGSLIRKQNRNWDLPWLGREDTWERKANHGDLEWPLLTGGNTLQEARMSHWPPGNSGLEGSGINNSMEAESVFSSLPPHPLLSKYLEGIPLGWSFPWGWERIVSEPDQGENSVYFLHEY